MENRTLKKSLLIILFSSTLAACGSNYIVPTGASGAQIFREACNGCHKAQDDPNVFFRIKAENRNLGSISSKINKGSLIMPAYANITGKHLQELSLFVLSHSVKK